MFADMPRTDVKVKTIYLWKADDKATYVCSPFVIVVVVVVGRQVPVLMLACFRLNW